MFNAHSYHVLAQAGLYGKASDGENEAGFNEIRDRAADLATSPFVSESGHPLGGSTADECPTAMKGVYQGMDSRLSGTEWENVADPGMVLRGPSGSGTPTTVAATSR